MLEKLKKWWSQEQPGKMDQIDYIILAVLLLGYGIFSFIHLGSMKNPQTFYEFSQKQADLVLKIDDSKSGVYKMRYFVGPSSGEFEVLGSANGEHYYNLANLEEKYVFSWQEVELALPTHTKYLKIVPKTLKTSLGEIQIYQEGQPPLTLLATNTAGKRVLDELDTVPKEISYYNSAYFDEVYFARTAYEYAHGLPTYEWVHPPLGKLIQAIPVYLFGMTPFTYRLMGNISGILLIGVMYIFGKNLFKKRKYALFAAGLMLFDNFHFAQSRMGTIDTHLVLFILTSFLFMYQYISLDSKASLKQKLLKLLFSGIFISCAIATKWTGLFAGLALAIIFFTHFYLTYCKTQKKTEKKKLEAKTIIFFCCIVFVLIPIAVYVLSYFLFPKVSIYRVDSFQGLVDITKGMFQYHNSLKETHPFSSNWYTWPMMLKPVWYYVDTYGSWKRTISGIGNPVIWWTGIAGMLFALYQAVRYHKKEALVLVVAILCMYLPYMRISRDMFLYHYFPVVPFMMLSIVFLIQYLEKKTKKCYLTWLYLALVIISFLYFFPVVSGQKKTTKQIEHRAWLKDWIF